MGGYVSKTPSGSLETLFNKTQSPVQPITLLYQDSRRKGLGARDYQEVDRIGRKLAIAFLPLEQVWFETRY